MHRFGYEVALTRLKMGDKVAREGWNGKGQFIGMQKPDENSANSLPYTFIVTVTGDRVPWVPSQTDQMAEDWYIHNFAQTDDTEEVKTTSDKIEDKAGSVEKDEPVSETPEEEQDVKSEGQDNGLSADAQIPEENN